MATTDPTALFVSMSSVLTGIPEKKLAPELDPNEPPLKNVYYDYAKSQDAATLQALLDVYQQNAGKPPAAIAQAIFQNADPMIGYLARSIMLQWYLGSWYSPQNLQQYRHKAQTPKDGDLHGPIPSVVISSTAYVNGWAWSMAQAHPMGNSNFSYGYWNSPPPPLSAYLGTTEK